MMAEGAPAESYIECDNRQGFHNAHEFALLYPDDARASFSYCLPRLEAGTAELAAIRARLFERAAALGHPTTADPDLHLVIDGVVVAAQSVADGHHTFRLDRAADEVWLASRRGLPAELNLLSRDRRCLGVCVQQLILRDDHLRLEVSHSHPRCATAFMKTKRGCGAGPQVWDGFRRTSCAPLLAASSSRCTACLPCSAIRSVRRSQRSRASSPAPLLRRSEPFGRIRDGSQSRQRKAGKSPATVRVHVGGPRWRQARRKRPLRCSELLDHLLS